MNKLLCPIIGLVLVCSPAQAQYTTFATPEPALLYPNPDAATLAKRKYVPLWSLGVGRWKQCLKVFQNADVGCSGVVDAMERRGANLLIQIRLFEFANAACIRDETCSIGQKFAEHDAAANARISGTTVEFLWDASLGPPPLAKGRKIYVGLDRYRRVVCFRLELLDITAARINSHGLLETIALLRPPAVLRREEDGSRRLDDSSKEGPKEFIYFRPRFTDLSVMIGSDVLWSPETGIILISLTEEAGDDANEAPPTPSKMVGTPVQNDAQFRFLPGREGWRLLKTLPAISGPYPYCYLVPENQFVCLSAVGVDRSPGIHNEFYDRGPVGTSRWIFPDSDTRLLTAVDLEHCSPDQLWSARNEIFARRGYIFTTNRGRKLAKSLGDAYHSTTANMDVVQTRMNAIERANAESIRNYESR